MKSLISYQIAPLTIVTLRAVLVTLTLIILMLILNRRALFIRPGDFFFFAAYGIFGVAAAFLCYFIAIDLNGVAVTTFLPYSYPVFVTILSVILLGERFTLHKVIALILAIAGISLISEIHNPVSLKLEMRGIMMALLASIFAAGYSIFGKKAIRQYSTWTIMLYTFAFAAFFLSIAQLSLLGVPDLGKPPVFWGLLIAITWIPTLGASLAYLNTLTIIEASQASVTATLEPVIVAILAFVFFRETLTPAQIMGALLVISAVIVVQR